MTEKDTLRCVKLENRRSLNSVSVELMVKDASLLVSLTIGSFRLKFDLFTFVFLPCIDASVDF